MTTAVDEAVEAELTEAISGRDYATFWTTQAPPGWLATALDQVATWLRTKLNLDMNLDIDGSMEHGSISVAVLHRPSKPEHGVRVEVLNENQGTIFTTTVLGVEDTRAGGGWLLLQTTASDRSRTADKPSVADMILDVVDFDDVNQLHAGPRRASLSQVQGIENLINAPDRRLPVILAASSDQLPMDAWAAAVRDWTKLCAGIAHVVVLDSAAAAEFNERHPGVQAQPATLRTYPPGSALHEATTRRTSRYLTTATLAARHPRDLQKTIQTFVRRSQIDSPHPIPATARTWNRHFDRIATRNLTEAATPQPSPLGTRINQRRAAEPANSDHLGQEQLVTGTGELSGLVREEVVERGPGSSMAATLQAELDQARAEIARQRNELERVRRHLCLDDLQESSLDELLESATRETADPAALRRLSVEVERLSERNETLNELVAVCQEDLVEMIRERDELQAVADRSVRQIEWLRSELDQTAPGHAVDWVDDDAQGPDSAAWFSNPTEQLAFDIYTSWVQRTTPSEKTKLPLAQWIAVPEFFDSWSKVQGLNRTKVINVLVDVLTGRAYDMPSRETHQLRTGSGGNDPFWSRPDGATCWRVSLQSKSPAARRLHFWHRSDGSIEFSSIRLHDDIRP